MAEGIEPEYKKMLGSTMSWNLQAKRRKIHTNGEAKPNIPSAPAKLSKHTEVCLDNLEQVGRQKELNPNIKNVGFDYELDFASKAPRNPYEW